MGTESLDKLAGTLVDSFFLERDRVLLEKLRELERVKRTKQELSRISGIHDDAVLDRLVALKVDPAVLAALEVLPLVLVAWADGEVDEKERHAVLDAAVHMEIAPDSVEYALLAQWLDQKPPPALAEAWSHYVRGLCAALGPAEREALRKELLGYAERIAAASGGLLGLGNRVSAAERRTLAELERAFRA